MQEMHVTALPGGSGGPPAAWAVMLLRPVAVAPALVPPAIAINSLWRTRALKEDRAKTSDSLAVVGVSI